MIAYLSFVFVCALIVSAYIWFLEKTAKRFENSPFWMKIDTERNNLIHFWTIVAICICALLSPLFWEFPLWFKDQKFRINNSNNPAQSSYQKIPWYGEWDHGTYISAQEGSIEIKRTFVIKNKDGKELCLETVLSITDYPLFVFEVCRAQKDFTRQSYGVYPGDTRDLWVLNEISNLLAWDNAPFEDWDQKRGALGPGWFDENRITSAQLIIKNAWIKPVLNEVSIVR